MEDINRNEAAEQPVSENEAQEPVTEAADSVEPNVADGGDEPTDEAQEASSDMVSDALKQNEELKKQLEELKNANTNVFEQNEVLKAELAEQQKLLKIAKENEELQAQLEGIKRNSLVESLIASGSLTNDMREWADSMSFDQLQEFAKHAPRVKNILQQTNEPSEIHDEELDAWKKDQNRSRIL